MKGNSRQDELYQQAAATCGSALQRFVRAYEADVDKQQDLIQSIHIALWQSFETYEGRCSIRTWVYRIAHNTAVSYVFREQRAHSRGWMSLDEIESVPDPDSADRSSVRRLDVEKLLDWIRRLKPFERQLMLLYLEGLDAESIGEIAGISAGNVRVQIHRVKTALVRRFQGGMK